MQMQFDKITTCLIPGHGCYITSKLHFRVTNYKLVHLHITLVCVKNYNVILGALHVMKIDVDIVM